MTAPKEAKAAKTNESNESSEGLLDPFKLESIFEDATQIFKPNRVKSASCADVLIAVDTNVLLLPYTIRKDGLSKIQKFYQDLRAQNRLYLPSRVAREFIVNRDRKLAELLKMINDVRSKINTGETGLSPILDGMDGSDEMVSASKEMTEAKKKYNKALEKVEKQVAEWSGDDPVSSVYDSVFDVNNIISPVQTNQEMLVEWKTRLKEKIPPGYKDGGKPDTGIGDFLVWKALLAIGKTHKKDLIFVTGEEKADWFVRGNGTRVYPRPELVAEYRKFSGGKRIRLIEFHDVLREMDVAPEIVTEVERAEATANNIIRVSNQIDNRNVLPNCVQARSQNSEIAVADFRMRYGGEAITFSSDDACFKFNLSEQAENSLWVYPNGLDRLNVVNDQPSGTFISTQTLSNIPQTFSVNRGQMIVATNPNGYTLAARLLRTNEPGTNGVFEASFSFVIRPPLFPLFAP